MESFILNTPLLNTPETHTQKTSNSFRLPIITKHTLLILFLLFAFLLSTCKDNVLVVPTSNQNVLIKDSAMFDWEYKQIFGYRLTDLYVADTNKIYISAVNGILFYDGVSFTNLLYNDPTFTPSTVQGTDEYNIYFGGDIFGTPFSALKKWNGSIFQSIEIPQDSSRTIVDILPIDANHLWLTTASNIVYYYDGLTIINTYLAENMQTTRPKLFKNPAGEIYLFGYVSSNGGYNFTFYTYKLMNSTWQQILVDNGNDNTALQRYLNICGTDAIRSGSSKVYSFTGTGWQDLKPSTEFYGSEFGGTSKNDFLCVGENKNFSFLHKIYYCDGNEWFNQSNYVFYGGNVPISDIHEKRGNFYSIIKNPDPEHVYLVIARPRKSVKK